MRSQGNDGEPVLQEKEHPFGRRTIFRRKGRIIFPRSSVSFEKGVVKIEDGREREEVRREAEKKDLHIFGPQEVWTKTQ